MNRRKGRNGLKNAEQNSFFPSNEEIASFIAASPSQLRVRDIAQAFGIAPQKRSQLRKILAELAFNAEHAEGSENTSSITLCEVCSIDSDGIALAKPISDNKDDTLLPISSADARRTPALHQRFLGRVRHDMADKHIDVIRILGREPQRLFGRIFKTASGWQFENAAKGRTEIIKCVDVPELGLEEDCLVEAVPDSGSGRTSLVRPIRNLGSIHKPDAFAALAIAEFELPHQFSEKALHQAAQAELPDAANRTDIRDLPLITIDGEDAKDFDDAVFAEPSGTDQWRLIVAIADVAYYVSPDSALDKEARIRGNSVYLPGTVVPMLPENLSNGLCSLRPDEDRACLCAEIIISADGQKTSHRFFRGLMRSHARLTYTQVQSVIEGDFTEADLKVPSGVLTHLITAYNCLFEARRKRGTLNLNIAEAKVQFNAENIPTEIIQQSQKQANQLIEEFMILANICAAETLEQAQKLCVFRVHDRPDPEKLQNLHELTDSLEIPFAKGQVITPHVLNKLLEKVKDTPAETAVNEAVLRSQSRAIYDVANIGHYGLGLSRYAHFTSPIRRYADLLVHRSILEHLGQSQSDKKLLSLDHAKEITAQISQTEQRAAKAERRTITRFAALLSAHKKGSQCVVKVSGIVGSGLFVRLDDGVTEGFIHRKSLPEDYYDIKDAGMSYQGKASGWTFSIGMEIEATILNVDIASGGVDLRWFAGGERKPLEPFQKGRRKKGHSPAPKRKNRHRR